MNAVATGAVDPILGQFWDLFDWLAVRVPATPGLNLSVQVDTVAFNLCHLESVARHFGRSLPLPIPELKARLEHSTAPRFIHDGVYNCHDGKGRRCMIFGLEP
jgi:hypothetical protein